MASKHAGVAPSPKSESDWQAEEDHRTLQRAGEVMNDPARMKAVGRQHQKMTRNIASVGSLLAAPEDRPVGKPTMRPKRRVPSRARGR